MMRSASVLVRRLCLSLLLCCGLVPAARAAPTITEIYEAHSREAEQLFKAGRYEESIEELRAAYAIIPKPRLLLNQGHAYLALKRPREALRMYERYKEKRESGTEEEDRKLERYLERARNLAEQQEEPPPVGWQTDGTSLALPQAVTKTIIVQASPPPEMRKPLYRRWWFWTGIGAVVAAGIVTGTVVGVLHAQPPMPDPGAQTYRPEFP